LLENAEAVLTILQQLKMLGVRISMDDFGTGYSSLSYLQKFPFDKIKIDQSFVRGANQRKDCDAIIRAVVALSENFGIKTVAEGVETHEQLERVRAGGCGSVQGYLTGRPLPAAEAASMMSRPSSSNEVQKD
jgi:EAL domain-containing protein (putative c-di-GMP-specific phosphodiesterase class I)